MRETRTDETPEESAGVGGRQSSPFACCRDPAQVVMTIDMASVIDRGADR